ncbi:MAG: alpha/beta hydrolase [Pseudomonadaceae bacterium]|nr:alpha/beta hydrolase [Pseudomonadaceae bacterium]
MAAVTSIDVELGELTFPVLVCGEESAPALLCIHGFPDNPNTFRHQFEPLASAGYRVIAPTLRGYAPSNIPANGCYQTVACAWDNLAIMEALGIDQAAVYGHDWGSPIASAMAVLAPERVRKLITSAVPYGPGVSTAFVTNAEQQRRSWYMFFFQMPFAEAAVAFDDYAYIRRLWREWSPTWELPDDALSDVITTLAQPDVLTAALGYYRAAFGGVGHDQAYANDEAKLGSPITVPALHFQGTADGCMGPELTEGMSAYFEAGLELHLLDDIGHFVHAEAPDVFNEKIIEFLAR